MTGELLEKHLRKTTIVSNVISIFVALVVAMSVGYGFYYNTKNTLNNHSNDIESIHTDVNRIQDKINDIDVFKGVSTEEVDNLSEKVEKMEHTIGKMDDKLDKILLQTR